MSIINLLIQKIRVYRINRNSESKCEYLRSLGCKVGRGTRFTGKLSIGSEPYLIEIGENCLLSGTIHFHTHDGAVKVLNSVGFFNGEAMDKVARIKIGNNCFIGNDARIMGGVKIGNNCVVGAGSIVTKSIPDGTVVAGVPAKIICTIQEFYEKNISRGVFFPTASMSATEKKEFLIKHVPELL